MKQFLILVFSAAFFVANAQTGFDNKKSFKIIDIRIGITEQSSAKDISPCREWKISKKDAAGIIRNAKVIEGAVWHHDFDVLPCIFTGRLKQEGRVYEFEINAGSWIYIKRGGELNILGNYEKSDGKFFLATPGNLQ